MITLAPASPLLGVIELTTGAATTVNTGPVVFCALIDTDTGPVVTPEGTFTTIMVSITDTTVATVPLKATISLEASVPKPTPWILSVVPAPPETGVIKVMAWGVKTGPVA